ncbi:MAG: glutamine--fructose-6-phosphate transaminase (isomerizing) [Acidobacteriota bacterium]
MCGIVGYVGKRNAIPILFDGLKRLEYRGYDSAGIIFNCNGKLVLRKAEGRLNRLAQLLDDLKQDVGFGIGHTRWATHGRPSTENAHPHLDCTGTLAVVHNGIIENYRELKDELIAAGHIFRSETDTEVIVHLIESYYCNNDLKSAVRQALSKLTGSFAIGLISADKPDRIIAARRFSPLVVGLGDHEYFLASDTPAILSHTSNEIVIGDEEMVEISSNGIEVTDLRSGNLVEKPVEQITWSAEQVEKSGFDSFMLKEIYEQPTAIRETLLGKILDLQGAIGITKLDVKKFDTVHIVACGTSYHAGLAGKYILESLAGIPVEVEMASEYRYRTIICNKKTLVLPISQSGETADTLAALELARAKGCSVLSICNVAGSNITRLSDDCIFTKAGPEIGVASTKAFTCQLVALLLLALHWGKTRNHIMQDQLLELIGALTRLPSDLECTLQLEPQIRELAFRYHNVNTFLFLGRWISYPVALEGALKLKEISYINAQGYAAGEMKHGPIALIEKGVPVVVLAAHNHVYGKVIGNIEEVRARGGSVIAITDENDNRLALEPTQVITLPRTRSLLTPILQAVLLQLLAYHIAILRGCDVDKPRNLAKSVTVE